MTLVKQLFCLAFSIVFLSGCKSLTATAEIPKIEKSSIVITQDLRSETEKKNKIFSLLLTSKAYGTYRRGDKLIEPNPVRILQHRVYEKFMPMGVIPDVKVHHFVVYMNLRDELIRGSLASSFGGVIGAAIAAGTQKYGVDGTMSLTSREEFESFEKEYKRALYTQRENPDKVSVYRVYLEAEINGKRTFVKIMTPTKLPKGDDRNAHLVAIETAIAFFLDHY